MIASLIAGIHCHTVKTIPVQYDHPFGFGPNAEFVPFADSIMPREQAWQIINTRIKAKGPMPAGIFTKNELGVMVWAETPAEEAPSKRDSPLQCRVGDWVLESTVSSWRGQGERRPFQRNLALVEINPSLSLEHFYWATAELFFFVRESDEKGRLIWKRVVCESESFFAA